MKYTFYTKDKIKYAKNIKTNQIFYILDNKLFCAMWDHTIIDTYCHHRKKYHGFCETYQSDCLPNPNRGPNGESGFIPCSQCINDNLEIFTLIEL